MDELRSGTRMVEQRTPLLRAPRTNSHGAYSGSGSAKKLIMNESTPSPWPAIIKIALLIGCTMGFCILGLISGVLAAKVMQTLAVRKAMISS
jgi:hypothetical protein